MPSPIELWRFDDAPKILQDLSDHGGDEDWILVIPPDLQGEYLPWAEDGDWMGCCSVSEHDHPERPGWKVRIGAHA